MNCPNCNSEMRFKRIIPYREGQPELKADYRCDACGIWMLLISKDIEKIKPKESD